MTPTRSKLLTSSEINNSTDKTEQARVISFPNSFVPVRVAQQSDIKGIIELWANSATLRFFFDPVRWNWKGRASEVWSDYARDLLQDPNKFLITCDLKDNGLSGFLIARIEELPNYYQAKYSLTVEEFYLRPKDRNLDMLKQMLQVLLNEAYSRQKLLVANGEISLKIEIVQSEDSLIELLEEAGFKRSSVTYTASIG
jgi:hypothetical protein